MNNTTEENGLPNNSFQPSPHFLSITIIRAIFTVVGVFGNGVVLFVIKSKKNQKTSNDIFILNLACADLLYICSANAQFLYNSLDRTPRSLFYCKAIFPTFSIFYTAGIFTITAMAIQRCRVILNPWKPKLRVRYTNMCVAIIWFLSIALLLPVPIFSENRETYCPLVADGWPKHADYIFFLVIFLFQYPIPLLIIIIAYTKIGIYMRNPRVPRSSVIARGNTLRSPSDETRKESIQITKTVGAIVLLYIILMLPLQIAMINGVIFQRKTSYWVSILWNYGDVLITVNSCLDPYVYSARTKQYRQQIAKWISWVCPFYHTRRHPRSHSDRSVFPAGHDKSFTNELTVRTVEDISLHFKENKGNISKLSFSMKNGVAKEGENSC